MILPRALAGLAVIILVCIKQRRPLVGGRDGAVKHLDTPIVKIETRPERHQNDSCEEHDEG